MQAHYFYEYQLLWLAIGCFIALIADHRASSRRRRETVKDSKDERAEGGISSAGTAGSLASLTRQYLTVYAIVMGADWLQGPYVYSLYSEQYQLAPNMVAILFVTGFISAGLAAPLVGVWADQHGRKRLCMIFCASYTCACLCILVPILPVLLFGRVLGGISTSILFSAFESWLISSANSHAIPQNDLSLIMGRATLVNGLIATAAGVFSNQLVGISGSFASPFIASGALLIVAWFVIRAMWTENFGGASDKASADPFQLGRLSIALRIVSEDTRLLVLGVTQTCFEGSMYLFVFLWVPSLQEFSTLTLLPLGYIFSAFMLSMMLGSLFYTLLSTSSSEGTLITHAKLSSSVCALAGLSLALSVSQQDERTRFWAFCLFEACVGMYYPVQGMLRGTLIANEQRATLSALFRVPLNIFVVVSLLTGVASAGARTTVLSACSVMLAAASILTGVFIVGKVDQTAARA
ncbi:hypothetical protein MIND_00137600 [Mycena indigotica]|uniref:Molybdate-anion transporter n=1 Tax=Mycena indigotica TaxID=2126181 RepID=A0A8H6WKX2_9AGAR|nr:uncharacterized protein MIND_00137600 [Mycena indigotica]KAF7316194.1 hypothetical protein MIND_00137600 [Mycena indigotica]